MIGNIEALSSDAIDAVIVDCATCGSALGHIYPKLMREMELPADDAEKIAAKVWDVTEFIAAHADRLEPHLRPDAPRQTVAYHLPCHLKNHGKDRNAAVSLLGRLPGVDFRQTPDWDVCCGGGGLFFNEFPDISADMVAGKVKNAMDSGAEHWATRLPGMPGPAVRQSAAKRHAGCVSSGGNCGTGTHVASQRATISNLKFEISNHKERSELWLTNITSKKIAARAAACASRSAPRTSWRYPPR